MKNEPASAAHDQHVAEAAEPAASIGARNFITIAPKAEAKVSMPDWNGVMPKPSWNISGSRNGTAPLPIRKIVPPMIAGAERAVGEDPRVEDRIGGAPRVADIGDAATDADRQRRDADDRRQRRQADHRQAEHDAGGGDRRKQEAGEVDRPRAEPARCRAARAPASQMPASPIGTLIRKIQCQVKKVVMKPPTGGPTSGPTSAGMVSQAIAETSSRFGVARTSTSRATGVIIAPPMPLREAREHEIEQRARHRAGDRAER